MAASSTTSTPKKRWTEVFLASLAQYGNVTKAAKAARIDRKTAYNERKANEEFASAWDEALEYGISGLEDEARRRAFEGVKRKKGIYHLGVQVGTETETVYSDTLLIFLLKAHKPEVYRETIRNEHSGPGGGPVTVQVLRGVSMDDL